MTLAALYVAAVCAVLALLGRRALRRHTLPCPPPSTHPYRTPGDVTLDGVLPEPCADWCAIGTKREHVICCTHDPLAPPPEARPAESDGWCPLQHCTLPDGHHGPHHTNVSVLFSRIAARRAREMGNG